jgi:cytochrome c oxidase assembly factor CtaG
MWAWHAPALFDRAIGHQGWHIAQHLSFLLTSLFFWWAMLHGRSDRSGYGTSAFCLFATSLIGGMLGALMTFSASPWYAGYVAMGMTPYGLSAIEDQQLAGLIMWIPGGLFHGIAALWFVHQWLKSSNRDAVPV